MVARRKVRVWGTARIPALICLAFSDLRTPGFPPSSAAPSKSNMKPTHPLHFIIAGWLFCLLSVTTSGADTWYPPTATTAQDGSFELTTVTRLNGCQFVLERYTNTDPALAGYWTQDVSILEQPLIHLTRQPASGMRSLKIENAGSYAVMQVDRNGDGIYETFLIYSSADRKLADVLLMTSSGWLRHGTAAEFSAGETLLAQTLRPVQEINSADDKAIRKVWDDMKRSLTKPN
jgi:hypothetical protein